MRSLQIVGTAALLATCAVRSVIAQEVKVDDAIASYTQVSGISGNLSSEGSDTLNNMMTHWGEEFKKLYPNVNIQVQGKGSGTAPPALGKGTAQLGPMSRAMKTEEEENVAKAKKGIKPTQISVALDCLAVFVHKDNPVKGLNFAQLDCIFSKTRNSGFKEVTKWGEAGAFGEDWVNLSISVYGRNPESGTYGFFKEHVLQKGDFKDMVKEQPGSAGVVSAIANDRGGIGYSGIGYRNSEVRAVKLSAAWNRDELEEKPLVAPTFENALNGTYPLGRSLYIYIVKEPGKPLPPLVKEFLKFVLSKEGQQLVIKDGFGPLPAEVVAENLKKLDVIEKAPEAETKPAETKAPASKKGSSKSK